MEASDSLSRTLGMFFFFPFPFPNFGIGFFYSLPVPKLWEWNFLFPFPFPNPQKSFPLTPEGNSNLLGQFNFSLHKAIGYDFATTSGTRWRPVQWTFSLDFVTGLSYWTFLLDFLTGLSYWTFLLDFLTGLSYWTFCWTLALFHFQDLM